MGKYTEEIYRILEENHLRLTQTRKVLLDILFLEEDPLSATHILGKMSERECDVNKTTVYRALEQFEERGIVRGVQLGDRTKYYELASRDHHHHLVCVQCECVEDIDMDETTLSEEEKKVGQERGFAILRHSLEFFGICRNCHTSPSK
ncbi:MAG: Fur family transcriptional regulator [Candidatus Moranbacteria bacterium]|nr:Fur family transcriptional regulator [Candidatus Moranbacteria bacterium]MDD3965284.1 Fur family transcriptional regulator [Candidatus Moranbacteria bacterium]